MNYFIKALKQYSDFNGRARRKEYWTFVLFNLIFALIAMGLDYVTGMASEIGFGPIYGLCILAFLLPGLAVLIRRLHDVGKSGWWIFISLIPIIGGIWLLIFLFSDGVRGPNEYGPNPKEALN